MYRNNIVRHIALILAFLLILPFFQIHTWAAEVILQESGIKNSKQNEVNETIGDTISNQSTVDEGNEIAEAKESILFLQIQSRIDDFLAMFGVTSESTDDEIANAIITADEETVNYAITEREALEQDACGLTEVELQKLENTDILTKFDSIWDQINSPMVLANELFNPIPEVSVANVNGNSSLSEGTVTITIKGSTLSKNTATITITNSNEKAGTVSFEYSVSNANAFTINGQTASSTGNFSQMLEKGGTITFSLQSKSGFGNKTATLTLGSFTFEAAPDSSDVTVIYDSSLGSVTSDGISLDDDRIVEGVSSEGTTLNATVKSGVTFLGWIDAEHRVISTEPSYKLIPSSDMTVQAAFASSSTSGWFICPKDADNYLYNDLNEAATFAASTSYKRVILAANGILPAENYVIPAGVTLLIPCDSTNTVYSTQPGIHEDTYTVPSVYRTLTLAVGTNIEVNGFVSVAGKQSSKYGYNGLVSGPYGKIQMNADSTIRVNSGAALYAWGYICGSGNVVINSGGTVYEDFQVEDYRGGDATSDIAKAKKVFPMSQYYLQNVEVPMTLYAGAIEKAYFSVSVTGAGTQKTTIPIVSSEDGGSMFEISSGYIVKDYKEGTGRLSFSIHGDVILSNMTINLKVDLIGSISIASSDYRLPIPAHFTVDAVSGDVTINQSLELHPGSELFIREGVNATLQPGVQVIAYSWSDWGGYVGEKEDKYIQLGYVPGGNGTTGREKDALVQVDGTLDGSLGAAYVTTGGANIYSTGTGVIIAPVTSSSTTAQISEQSKNSWGGQDIAYNEGIPIQSPILRDGGSGGIETIQAASAGRYTYYTDTQKWCPPGHRYVESVIAPTCLQDGYTTHTCIACSDYYSDSTTTALGHTEVIGAAIAATCTATGLTEGKHCSVCNEVLIAQEEIPALGHAWNEGEVTKEPSLSETGIRIYTCTVCGETKEETIAKTAVAQIGEKLYASFGDALEAATSSDTIQLLSMPADNPEIDKNVTIDLNGTGYALTYKKGWTSVDVNGDIHTIGFKVYGTSVRVGDNLDLYFYVQSNQLENGKAYVAQITKEDTIETIPSSKWESYNNGTYLRFCYNDIAAKEMTDDVTVEIFYADAEGNATTQRASYTCAESVAKYAKRTLQNEVAKNNDELITVLVDMLNYGASCQTYFTYKDDASQLANVGIKSYQKDYAGKYGKAWTAISNDVDLGYSANVTAESKLVFSFYFATSAIQATDATVTYRDHYGNDVVKTITPIVEDGQYRIKVEGLAVADGRQQITCTVKTINDKEVSITSSIESYVATIENDNSKWDVVFRDLMYFVDSAYEYFH